MRKVIITQEQAEYIQKKLIGEEIGLPTPQKAGKPYFISPEKVLIVKRFLDSNFKNFFLIIYIINPFIYFG